MRQTRLSILAFLATSALTVPAAAQEASVTAFPVRQYQDENGVDLLAGIYTTPSPTVRIGDPGMGLTYVREVRGGTFRDTAMWNVVISGSTYTVAMGSRSKVFTCTAGICTPNEQNGSSLTYVPGSLTFTAADGTVATFLMGQVDFGNARGNVVTSVVYPSGRSLTFHYKTGGYPDTHGSDRLGRRLQAVTTNAGYHMHFRYASDIVTNLSTAMTWSRIINVKGLNSAVDSCLPTANSCPETGRPEMNIASTSSTVWDYTDAESRLTKYTLSGNLVTAVRLPGSLSNNVAVSYTSGKVTSVTNRGVTTGYAYADASGVRTVTVTRPGGSTRVLTFDIARSLLLTDTNEVGKTRGYQYDSNNRVTRLTQPEGNYTQLTYDGRGNVTEVRAVAKSGSGVADVVETASFDSSCANIKTCNRPNSATDARGNTTDFTYDSAHGGLLTATAPAAMGGANRPQTRVSYSRLGANGASSASGIYVQTGNSTCQTGTSPSCVGTSDEVKGVITYGYGLQPLSISSGAGDNSLTVTNAMTYDVVGNLLTVDGPLSGTADTTRRRWNLNREQVGMVGPDPDGGGSRKHLATKTTYASTGLVSKVEFGTVNSQSDPD